jgi:hypothetical protein
LLRYEHLGLHDRLAKQSKKLSPFSSQFFLSGILLKWPPARNSGKMGLFKPKQENSGYCELDNHATVKKLGGFHIEAFSFDRAFKFIRTHVLTKEKFCGNSKQDINMILASLNYGCCYVALEYFRESIGFDFNIEQNSQKFFMGDILLYRVKPCCMYLYPHGL